MADSFVSEYREQIAQAFESAKVSLRVACAELEQLGVDKVIVQYDGQGDEGAVDQITFEPVLADKIAPRLLDAISEAACEFLPDGWKVSEGAYGTLEIDVGGRRVHRDHNWRCTQNDVNEFEL